MTAVTVLAAMAADKLTLGFTADVPRVGLRFRPVEQISPLPAAAPHARPLRREGDGLEITVYEVEELWRAEQLAALFTNAVGRIRVAAVDWPLPEDVPVILEKYVTRELFDQARANAEPEWRDEDLMAWVAAFTGEEVERGRILGRERAMPVPCLEFVPLESGSGFRRFYVMRNPQASGPQFVFFEYAFAPGFSEQAAEAAALGSLRSVVKGTLRAGPKAADPRFQRGGAVHEDARSAPAYAAARKRVQDEVGALDDWWHAEMQHYLLASNLGPGDRELAEVLQKAVPAVRRGFAAFVEPIDDVSEVSVIRVFNERRQYEDYVGPDHRWTLGLWMPSRRELVISPVMSPLGGPSPGLKESIVDTALHEAWHQYAFYALNEAVLPKWFDEGHACLFESVRFNRLGVLERLEENEDRHRILDRARYVGKEPKLDELMRLNGETFYGEGDLGRDANYLRGVNYGASWALVYFLRKAVPVLHPTAGYADLCDRVVGEVIKRPHDPVAAMDAALEGMDVDALQGDYDAFWASKSDRGKVERHTIVRP